MRIKPFNKIVIVGVGLIGGSLGLAVKKKRLAKEVVGLCRRRSSLKKALKARAVDWGTIDARKASVNADFIIIATPAGSIVRLAKEISKYLKRGAIITDVGSVKEALVGAIEHIIPAGIHFIGGHPMAGSEQGGVIFAKEDIFEQSLCILTKTKKTDVGALRRVASFWKALGVRVSVTDVFTHDKRVAQVSHLPHLIAQSLCLSADGESLRYASGSFRDTTRVASLNTKVWIDIFKLNRKHLLVSLDRYIRVLKQARRDLAKNDFTRLKMKIEKASRIRTALFKDQ